MRLLVVLLAVLTSGQQLQRRPNYKVSVRLAEQGFFSQGKSFRSSSSSPNNHLQPGSFTDSNRFHTANNFDNLGERLGGSNFQHRTDLNRGSGSISQSRSSFQSSSSNSQDVSGFQRGNGFSLRGIDGSQANADSQGANNFLNNFASTNSDGSPSFNGFGSSSSVQTGSSFEISSGSQPDLRSGSDIGIQSFQTTDDSQGSSGFPSTGNNFRSVSLLQNNQGSLHSLSLQSKNEDRFQANQNGLQSNILQNPNRGSSQSTIFQEDSIQNQDRANRIQQSRDAFVQGNQFQSSSFQTSASFGSSSDSPKGAFEPLNLPSGASVLLGTISSSFSCVNRPYGYYADQENSCRVFHVCNPALFENGDIYTYHYSFMCGEGSVFEQKEMTCVAEKEASSCQEASDYYFRNEEFGFPHERTF